MKHPVYSKRKKQRKSNNQSNKRIIELHNQGLRNKDIAERLNFSEYWVYKVLKKNGISTKKVVVISYEDLYKDYVVDGLSTTDLAVKYKCHHKTILYKLKAYGIPTRSVIEGIRLATQQGKNTFQNQVKRECEKWKNLKK